MLAVIGLAALVTAVVTSNALIAWVCIVASAIGVLLLIVDAVRERTRSKRAEAGESDEEHADGEPPPHYVEYEDYPEEASEPAASEATASDDTSVIEPVTETSTESTEPAGDGDENNR
ncbi:hypothetical protein C731_2616 [Mycolicibacterium hassiacum DSM 44199]|uniref:Transmembrane protein n=1 Tax=Mycolicibacterium hassiacum (strain DSM 44199 / CIP 105218 / JCM 12690 / 3849) TaxID=1122247 RepID=K5BB48_MYCHD|nr:hypothetical protein C731_2616 [Mycolicibacterium hassiacum DSM 44199]